MSRELEMALQRARCDTRRDKKKLEAAIRVLHGDHPTWKAEKLMYEAKAVVTNTEKK